MKLTKDQIESLASGLKNTNKKVITVKEYYLKLKKENYVR